MLNETLPALERSLLMGNPLGTEMIYLQYLCLVGPAVALPTLLILGKGKHPERKCYKLLVTFRGLRLSRTYHQPGQEHVIFQDHHGQYIPRDSLR